MNRPDPTTTHRLTTAAVPEWAAEATVGVPRMLAEIARLRAELSRERTFVDVARDQFIRTRESDLRVLSSRDDEIARLKRELADVKAECCRLTDVNGDLKSKLTEHNERLARLKRIMGETSISLRPMLGEWLRETIDDAIILADHNHLPVAFTFNDTPGVARPGDAIDEVWQRWFTQREKDQAARKTSLAKAEEPQ